MSPEARCDATTHFKNNLLEKTSRKIDLLSILEILIPDYSLLITAHERRKR